MLPSRGIKMYLLVSAFFGILSLSKCDNVPLLAWTSISSCCKDIEEISGSINTIKPHSLQNPLKQILDSNQKLIVFIEDYLAVEDFSLRTINGDRSFHNLQKMYETKKMFYLPNVFDPLEVLNEISKNYSIQIFKNNISNLGFQKCEKDNLYEIEQENKQIVLISMPKESENKSRAEFLADHDKLVTDFCNCMEIHSKVLCILTGVRGYPINSSDESDIKSLYIKKRKFKTEEYESNINALINGDNLHGQDAVRLCQKDCYFEVSDQMSAMLVFIENLPRLFYKNKIYPFNNYFATLETINADVMNMRIISRNVSISFRVEFKNPNTWELIDVSASVEGNNIALKGAQQIIADTGYSCPCQDTEFEGRDTYLMISRIQIEPFFYDAPASAASGNRVVREHPTVPAGPYSYGHDPAPPGTAARPYDRAGALRGRELRQKPGDKPGDKPPGDKPPEDTPPGDKPSEGNKTKNTTTTTTEKDTKNLTNELKFGGPQWCIPFQNIAVWIGFIVMSGMVLLLAWAVGMLISVGRNVTFDGPQQTVLLRD